MRAAEVHMSALYTPRRATETTEAGARFGTAIFSLRSVDRTAVDENDAIGIGMRPIPPIGKMNPSAWRGMSAAVLLPVPRFPLALVCVLAFVSMAVGGCDGDAENGGRDDGAEGEGEGEAAPEYLGGCGAPVVVDAEVCGNCFSGSADICGVADEAICEVRENSAGRACQLCIAASGTILFNDCVRADDVDAASCELTPGQTAGDVCRSCFDANGSIVSVSCAPAADRCEVDVEIDGRRCNRCFKAGVLVSTVCAPPELDPRRCVAYENDVGRCVDCYGDNNVLLAHDCRIATDAEAAGLSCESRFSAGLRCTTCADSAGQVVSQNCRDDVPGSDRCERLEFSDQSCVVCVDTSDTLVFVDCVDNTCAAEVGCRVDSDCTESQVCFDGRCVGRAGEDTGGEKDPSVTICVEPPTCSTSRNAAGDLCRSCPSSADGIEVRCLASSSLTCETVDEASLPPATNSSVGEQPVTGPEEPTGRPSPQGRTCVLCRDRAVGVEVYRDCEGNGVVPPPYCSNTTDVDGSTCAACYDAISSDVRCAVRGRCDDGLSADVSACSDATVAVAIYPRACRNPWAAWRDSDARNADLAGIMAWTLDVHQVVVAASSAASSTTTPACLADDCSCARGDVVTLTVAELDRPRIERAFAAFLRP